MITLGPMIGGVLLAGLLINPAPPTGAEAVGSPDVRSSPGISPPVAGRGRLVVSADGTELLRVGTRGRTSKVADLVWGPDGRLYVTESGTPIRIGPRGTRQVVPGSTFTIKNLP